MFGLINFLWGDIGIPGKSQGSSTRKPQVSIKSQTGVMAEKTAKNHHFGLVIFLCGDIGISGMSQGSSTQKTGFYQVPNWSYGQKAVKNHNF